MRGRKDVKAEKEVSRGRGRGRRMVGNGDTETEEEAEEKLVTTAAREVKGKQPLRIVIPAIATTKVRFELIGTTELIVNNFSEKSKEEIRAKQQGRATGKREKKNPFEQFLGSLYFMNDRQRFPSKHMDIGDYIGYKPNMFGIPSPAFKNAMISACRYIDGVPMTLVTGALHVEEYLVPIRYKRLTMREDPVRVGKFPNKVADLRYRAEFSQWSCIVTVKFNSRIFNAAQIGNLLNHAGFHVGLCEWRMEKKGRFGMFEVGSGRGR